MRVKKTKFQKIKTFIKLSVAFGLVVLFVFLGFFVKHKRSFENSDMGKWTTLSDVQRIETLQKIIPNIEDQDLLLACMDKIATLPESSNMIIQSAASLCHNGIKLNSIPDTEPQKSENQNDKR